MKYLVLLILAGCQTCPPPDRKLDFGLEECREELEISKRIECEGI